MNQMQFDQQTLDIGSIQGVQEHFRSSGGFPILVFREKRQIRTIVNPFPGIWRLDAPGQSLNLIAGRNTFKGKVGETEPVLELAAGDEIVIVPIMSAVRPGGPRIQVPALLADDIGVVEMDVVSEDEGAEDLEDILTLTELRDEALVSDPGEDEAETVRLSPESRGEPSPEGTDEKKEPTPCPDAPTDGEGEAVEVIVPPSLELPDELDSALEHLLDDDPEPDASCELHHPLQAAWHVISHAGGAA